MVTTSLVLHRGAEEVPRAQLVEYLAPDPQGRWYPVAHARAVDLVSETLTAAGYQTVRERFGVSHDGQRMFGTLDLATPLNGDGSVTLAVGIRNSTDKSFPLGFCAGNRVFVCDNLAFSSELLIRRKHTKFGEVRFTNAIAGAVSSLSSFVEQEKARVARLQSCQITDEIASRLILLGDYPMKASNYFFFPHNVRHLILNHNINIL